MALLKRKKKKKKEKRETEQAIMDSKCNRVRVRYV